MNRWIPVAGKLPDPGDVVVAKCGNEYWNGLCIVQCLNEDGATYWVNWYNGDVLTTDEEPVEWFPFPGREQ